MSQCSNLNLLLLTSHPSSIIATFQLLFTVKLLRVSCSRCLHSYASYTHLRSLRLRSHQGHLKWHLPKSSVTSILSNPMVNFQLPTYWNPPQYLRTTSFLKYFIHFSSKTTVKILVSLTYPATHLSLSLFFCSFSFFRILNVLVLQVCYGQHICVPMFNIQPPRAWY